MSVYKNNNKILSIFVVLFTLFIVVIVTKQQIKTMQEQLDLKETYSSTLVTKKALLQELNDKKALVSKSSQEIDKYLVKINEDELIDYIYSYIESINDNNWVVEIKSLSISEPSDTEIWFKKTNISLNLKVPSEEKLKEILSFLTSSTSKYNFFIESFSFPYWEETEWSYSVSIPLTVLNK